MGDPPLIEHTGDILWWMADPSETISRTSIMIDDHGTTIAIDPVDCDGLDAAIENAGGLDGVAVLMDRHSRDARAIADRYEVPVFVPDGATRIAQAVGGPTASLDDALAETDFELRWLIDNRFWEEVCLWRPTDRTLIVPESFGTAATFTTGGEIVGVHPMVRLQPPRRRLGGINPERLFVGHGRPITDPDDIDLQRTLAMARRRLPRAWLSGIRALLP